MKKIILIFMMLICAVSLNAQNDVWKIGKDVMLDPDGSVAYKHRVNYFDAFSYYQEKAGKKFILGGISLGLTTLIGVTPSFIAILNPEVSPENMKSITQICVIGTSVGFITTLVCFISGGSNLRKASIVLKNEKKFIIETNGTSLKFRF